MAYLWALWVPSRVLEASGGERTCPTCCRWICPPQTDPRKNCTPSRGKGGFLSIYCTEYYSYFRVTNNYIFYARERFYLTTSSNAYCIVFSFFKILLKYFYEIFRKHYLNLINIQVLEYISEFGSVYPILFGPIPGQNVRTGHSNCLFDFSAVI